MLQSRHRLLVLGSVSLLPWLAAPALAQESGPALAQESGPALAQESGRGNDPILWVPPVSITATRTPMPAFETPGSVTVIERDEIERRMPSSLDDVIGDVPGVLSTGGPRRTGEEPSVRGFSGRDVIVTVDGARQNYDSGHDGRVLIDPGFLAEAEVVKGSSTALYGSGGTGGVVALRTVTPDDFLEDGETYGVTVGGGYGTVDGEGQTNVIGYAKPFEGVDLLAGFQFRQAGSITLGDDGALDAKDDIRSGLVKAGFDMGDGHSVDVSYQIFNNEAREPNNGQSVADSSNLEADKLVRNQSVVLTYGLQPSGTDLVDVEVTAYRNASFVDEAETSGSDAGVLQSRKLNTLGIDVANTSRLDLGDGVNLAVTYGGEVYRDKAEGSEGEAERAGVASARQDFKGAFVQAAATWTEPFGIEGAKASITPAVRFDDYKAEGEGSASGLDVHESQWSPKVAATVSPVPWFFAYGSYAKAFRAPTADELFATGQHFAIGLGANTFLTNPDLRPQTTTTWEGGGGLQFHDIALEDDTLQVKSGIYRLKGKDFIDLEVTGPQATCFFLGTNCGNSQSVNVRDARINGVEAEVTYDSPRVRVATGFHSMNTTDLDTGQPLYLEQADTGTVDARLKVPEIGALFGWRIEAAANFNEGTDTDNYRDGYIVNDFYANWRPGDAVLGGAADGLNVGLAVDNALDKAYRRTGSNVTEEGRDVRFAVSYGMAW